MSNRNVSPQWSPVLSNGITREAPARDAGDGLAAMKPGLIDRDHKPSERCPDDYGVAAMEPGLIDRDHDLAVVPDLGVLLAAMEPGLIDRDHRAWWLTIATWFQPQWSPVLSTGITSTWISMRGYPSEYSGH